MRLTSCCAAGELQAALCDQAETHTETLMPGYTHVQPAQPITAGHWLMSFFWMLARDVTGCADARRRMAVCRSDRGRWPGRPSIDRVALAEELGFTR